MSGGKPADAKTKRPHRKRFRVDPVTTMFLAGASIEPDTSPMLPSDDDFMADLARDPLGLDSAPVDPAAGVFGGYKKGEPKP